MAYLVIKYDGKTHRIGLDQTTSIGRDPKCGCFFPDRTLSREHCKISKLDGEDDKWMIVDLTSRNGTYLNRRRVEWHLLSEGDQISVGDLQAIFHAGRYIARPAHPEAAMVDALMESAPPSPVAPSDNDLHATKVTVYDESLMPGKVSFAPTEGEPVVKPYALPFQRPRPQPKIKK